MTNISNKRVFKLLADKTLEIDYEVLPEPEDDYVWFSVEDTLIWSLNLDDVKALILFLVDYIDSRAPKYAPFSGPAP